MDARSFGMFLKENLMAEARKYESNLLSAAYDDLSTAKRAGGIRDTLIGIANSIEPALEDFRKKQENA
jgi:hypothetical protein